VVDLRQTSKTSWILLVSVGETLPPEAVVTQKMSSTAAPVPPISALTTLRPRDAKVAVRLPRRPGWFSLHLRDMTVEVGWVSLEMEKLP